MRIDNIEIENYKSFLERQSITFEPGFNLLIGTNNAGKTSVLDVLDLDVNLNDPHRSERTVPKYGGLTSQASKVSVSIATNFNELWQLSGATQLYLPLTPQPNGGIAPNAENLIDEFICTNSPISLKSTIHQGTERIDLKATHLFSGTASHLTTNEPLIAALIQSNPQHKKPSIQTSNFAGIRGIIANYSQPFKSKIYRFSANRRPGFHCGIQVNNILDREAVSLPYCLNNLQTNDAHGHQILCEWVNRVFPSVKWIQSTSSPSGFEIRCLPNSPKDRRDDLAISMSRMGAGIGNVIAMFYVVMTSREPQVIAIDEPNAFLHPRALRELLAILEAEGKQHQFILTAHSADVLTAVNARSIALLEFDGVATNVQQVGSKDLHLLRGELAALGIRISDLHAKDRVLWVEGQTEELVMPELLRWACPEIAAGTSVLRVERTGTFDKKSIEPTEIANIYERLSTSSAMVPPMVCILLDGETRSKDARAKIASSSGGKLRFLDRRMLENYLLHPGAIVANLLELGVTSNSADIEIEIQSQLATENELETDGAAILKKIFSEASKTTYEFRKTRDVPVLVSWILENDPEHLRPLSDCLRRSFGL